MKKAVLCLALALPQGCKFHKAKGSAADVSQNGQTATGIVDASGMPVKLRPSFVLPNPDRITAFLAVIARFDPVWSTLLSRGFGSENPKAPRLTATDSDCFMTAASMRKVRAYYDR